MKNVKKLILMIGVVFAVLATACRNDLSEIVGDLFDEEGHALYLQDDNDLFTIKEPTRIKFFVEVSGSMNGFFRANKPTEFKNDVYEIMSHYKDVGDSVNIMQDLVGNYSTVSLADFRNQMNIGKFGSSPNSTDMKSMITKILNNLNVKKGEVAVLVSDMKFDPVGGVAPDVQVAQYYTDVAILFKNFGKAVSLVCGTSDYLDAKGGVRVAQSPYYYLILGNGSQVASVRNYISKTLKDNGHFVDNIETGFNYGRAPFTFGIPTYCEQFENEPSFYDYEAEDDEDTCTINLKIDLQNYRWLLSDERIFKKSFTAKCLYGSELRVSSIVVVQEGKIPVASVDLKVSNMPQEADVIEWNIELPDQDHSKMVRFWENADDPNDPAKSYSLEGFGIGMFKDGNGNQKLKPNYILIKK